MPRKDGRPRSLPLPEYAKRPDWEFDMVTNRPLGPEPVACKHDYQPRVSGGSLCTKCNEWVDFRLDPQPLVHSHDGCYMDGARAMLRDRNDQDEFKPRDGYSQNEDDYA